MKRIIKTEHFLLRAWQRGIHQSSIRKITKLINSDELQNKSIVLVGKERLKKLGIKTNKSALVIIVRKKSVLITTFFVENIYEYLKSQKEKMQTIIL